MKNFLHMLPEVLSSLTASLGVQLATYQAAEQEFKNPIYNAAQMAMMMVNTSDLKNFTGIHNNPLLYGATIAADDFLVDKLGWSKHYLTDILSAIDFCKLLGNIFGADISGYEAPITLCTLGFKYLKDYYNGSKDLIHVTRDLQLKAHKNMKEIEYVTDGAVNTKYVVASQILANKLISMLPGTFPTEIQAMLAPISTFAISEYFGGNGFQKIQDKNQKILKSPMSLLKASSQDAHMATLQDIDRLSYEAHNMLSSTIEINSGLLNIYQLFSTEKFTFPAFNLLTICGELYQKANNVEALTMLRQYQRAGAKIKTELISHPRTIIERDGVEYFAHKSAAIDEKILEIHQNISSGTTELQKVFMLSMIKNGLLSFGLFGHSSVCNFLTMTGLYQSINALPGAILNEPSLRSLASLYKFLESVKNTSKVTYQSHNYENLKGLYLNNLNITINGAEKLNMDYLFLESGSWYLLTGKSGCGKTTLMSTLRGLPNFAESIEISGNAFYPKTTSDGKPQIYMLTQNNNFPYMVSIMEAILYPMITTEEERLSYKTLVEEIILKMDGITRDSEDGKEYLESGLLSRLFEIENDIYSVTSGGQQKKMSLTGMIVRIMKETGMLDIYNDKIFGGFTHDQAMKIAKDSVGPVLVLIDEVFNGLDSGMSSVGFASSSKGYVMKTLKESLPTKAIVVSVEHQSQLDQYNHRIHLNGDGTHTFTNPQTGAVESMKSYETNIIQLESFYPFGEVFVDGIETTCESDVSQLENIQPLPELTYVTASA